MSLKLPIRKLLSFAGVCCVTIVILYLCYVDMVHYLIERKSYSTLSTILSTEINPDLIARFVNSPTAMEIAVETEDPKLVEILLKQGISAEYPNQGITPLIAVVSNLDDDNIEESTRIMRQLLEAGANPNSSVGGEPLLLLSAGLVDATEPLTVLIEFNADTNIKNKW